MNFALLDETMADGFSISGVGDDLEVAVASGVAVCSGVEVNGGVCVNSGVDVFVDTDEPHAERNTVSNETNKSIFFMF
jgi:hypothetical protein